MLFLWIRRFTAKVYGRHTQNNNCESSLSNNHTYTQDVTRPCLTQLTLGLQCYLLGLMNLLYLMLVTSIKHCIEKLDVQFDSVK